MEEWRAKAIKHLKKSRDPDMQKAIRVLREGKGFLTSVRPIQIVFYEEMDSDDNAIK